MDPLPCNQMNLTADLAYLVGILTEQHVEDGKTGTWRNSVVLLKNQPTLYSRSVGSIICSAEEISDKFKFFVKS